MSAGPLRMVLDCVQAGGTSVIEVSSRTGLPTDVVRAALEQLQRMGHLPQQPIAMQCPPRGCGSCDVSGCGSGAVMLTLGRRSA